MAILKSVSSHFIGTTATDIYTVPADTVTIIKEVVVANDTNLGAKYELILTKSGGATTKLIPLTDLSSYECHLCSFSTFLGVGDKLQARADTESAIDVTVSLVEVS